MGEGEYIKKTHRLLCVCPVPAGGRHFQELHRSGNTTSHVQLAFLS